MDFALERAKLIDYLQAQIKDKRVLAALRRVPRECFVPDEYEPAAYLDQPLPIGYNQTISQPLIVALMAQAMELKGQEKVLEVGTGSGYQAAILAELAEQVITTERIPSLAEKAQRALNSLCYSNIKIYISDERLGWEAEAPFDAIVVAAGAPQVPDQLLEQLVTGGRLVIPVGTRDSQQLYQIKKGKDRNIIRNLGGCRFVPLIGNEAWEEDQFTGNI
jgi:protein-L-isoaspartate(D-aspartate) O-methyltransferase